MTMKEQTCSIDRSRAGLDQVSSKSRQWQASGRWQKLANCSDHQTLTRTHARTHAASFVEVTPGIKRIQTLTRACVARAKDTVAGRQRASASTEAESSDRGLSRLSPLASRAYSVVILRTEGRRSRWMVAQSQSQGQSQSRQLPVRGGQALYAAPAQPGT